MTKPTHRRMEIPNAVLAYAHKHPGMYLTSAELQGELGYERYLINNAFATLLRQGLITRQGLGIYVYFPAKAEDVKAKELQSHLREGALYEYMMITKNGTILVKDENNRVYTLKEIDV